MEQVQEWGRRVLGEAMDRLRPHLAPGLTVARCALAREEGRWRVRLVCRWTGEGCGARSCAGSAPARLGPGWPPGDPGAQRRLLLALAQAVEEVAMASGLGLAACRWPLRPARPCPGRASGGGARTAGGCG